MEKSDNEENIYKNNEEDSKRNKKKSKGKGDYISNKSG